MISIDAAALLEISVMARASEIHNAFRRKALEVDIRNPSDPCANAKMAKLKAARKLLLSRRSNERADAHRDFGARGGAAHDHVRNTPWWRRSRPIPSEPILDLHSLCWPGVVYVDSDFFGGHDLDIRPTEGAESFAVVRKATREVIGALVRHPQNRTYFCFRGDDGVIGRFDGVLFWTFNGSSIEPIDEGGA
jgi:curved DNA-binding protein CbpA